MIEKNGLSTESGLEYTQYNSLTTTSRPSNTFGGINYALEKDGGVRDRFVSRFDEVNYINLTLMDII